MSKSLKKVWNVVSSILVALVVILALLLVGARVAGLQVFTVLSGSMEPTYHVGALIYVKKTAPEDIQAGDVITFMLNETTTATHRVVAVDLRGFGDGEPIDAADALDRMLRALGLPPEQIALDPDERSAQLRSQLADRRVLLILDNASSARQVRPLASSTRSTSVKSGALKLPSSS